MESFQKAVSTCCPKIFQNNHSYKCESKSGYQDHCPFYKRKGQHQSTWNQRSPKKLEVQSFLKEGQKISTQIDVPIKLLSDPIKSGIVRISNKKCTFPQRYINRKVWKYSHILQPELKRIILHGLC